MSRDQFIRTNGAWDTRHWICVPGLSHEADGLQLEKLLSDLKGVTQVHADPGRHRVRITYDQIQVDYQLILEQLELIGFPAASGWWSRRKGVWFQYLDRNARENANVPELPCCSNPRGISAQAKKKK